MTDDRRSPERRLLDDARKAKAALYEARAVIVRQAEVLAEMRAELLAIRLRGRLRVDEFEAFVGVVNVLREDGIRIDDEVLELRVTALLRERPYLAAGAVGGAA